MIVRSFHQEECMKASHLMTVPIMSLGLLLAPSPGDEGMAGWVGTKEAVAAVAGCKVKVRTCIGMEIGGWSVELCVSYEQEAPCPA